METRNLGFSLINLREDGEAAFVVSKAGLSRRHAPRRAIEKPRTQQLLQFHDRFADRRSRQVEASRRLRVAAARDDPCKGIHGFQFVHLYPNWNQIDLNIAYCPFSVNDRYFRLSSEFHGQGRHSK